MLFLASDISDGTFNQCVHLLYMLNCTHLFVYEVGFAVARAGETGRRGVHVPLPVARLPLAPGHVAAPLRLSV